MARVFHPVVRSSSDPDISSSSFGTNSNTSSQLGMNSFLPRLQNDQMAVPIYTAAASEEEVQAAGHVLLHDFIHREFEDDDLSDDVLLRNPPPEAAGDVAAEIYQGPVYRRHAANANFLSGVPDGYTPPSLIKVGYTIQQLANEFAKSRYRQQIKKEADEVDLGLINQDSFFGLLRVIFANGVSKDGIIALFFFCADILKRCVREKLTQIGSELFWWSMQYVSKEVCRWVYSQGGWDQVFRKMYNVFYNAVAITAFSIFIICGCVYLKKNW